MKPKRPAHQAQREFFRVELEQLVDAGHPLVKLGRRINWTVFFEERLGPTYATRTGAPGVSTRLMVALHYLKYQHDNLYRGDRPVVRFQPYHKLFCSCHVRHRKLRLPRFSGHAG